MVEHEEETEDWSIGYLVERHMPTRHIGKIVHLIAEERLNMSCPICADIANDVRYEVHWNELCIIGRCLWHGKFTLVFEVKGDQAHGQSLSWADERG